jgi:bifunctional DNA-binding transcriptional regulator/antitoxin component of YhaV-PrlF toxin-antitoxin module
MALAYEISYAGVVDDPEPPQPRKVGDRGQVQIPPELLEALGIEAREFVWIGLNPDRPGTLVILTNDAMKRIYEKGWASAG